LIKINEYVLLISWPVLTQKLINNKWL
jgi:hypothetical protein